jgi:hypothetical protein
VKVILALFTHQFVTILATLAINLRRFSRASRRTEARSRLEVSRALRAVATKSHAATVFIAQLSPAALISGYFFLNITLKPAG